MLLQDQERVLGEFLGDVSGLRILDMATGTGAQRLPWRTRRDRPGVDASYAC